MLEFDGVVILRHSVKCRRYSFSVLVRIPVCDINSRYRSPIQKSESDSSAPRAALGQLFCQQCESRKEAVSTSMVVKVVEDRGMCRRRC